MFPSKKPKPTVLIIDDDEQIRGLLTTVLVEAYDCHAAASAEEALKKLGSTTFDLILSDIDMGGMSDLELVPHVHSLSPDTVVVMISGHNEIEIAIQAMRAGAFDYIAKPLVLQHVE